MAYIRKRMKKGRPYYSVVESRRDGPDKQPRQHNIYYIGNEEKLMKLALKGWRAMQAEGQEDPVPEARDKSTDA